MRVLPRTLATSASDSSEWPCAYRKRGVGLRVVTPDIIMSMYVQCSGGECVCVCVLCHHTASCGLVLLPTYSIHMCAPLQPPPEQESPLAGVAPAGDITPKMCATYLQAPLPLSQ